MTLNEAFAVRTKELLKEKKLTQGKYPWGIFQNIQ